MLKSFIKERIEGVPKLNIVFAIFQSTRCSSYMFSSLACTDLCIFTFKIVQAFCYRVPSNRHSSMDFSDLLTQRIQAWNRPGCSAFARNLQRDNTFNVGENSLGKKRVHPGWCIFEEDLERCVCNIWHETVPVRFVIPIDIVLKAKSEEVFGFASTLAGIKKWTEVLKGEH